MLTSESKEIAVVGNCEVSGVLLSEIIEGMNHHIHTFDGGDDLRDFFSAHAGEVNLLTIDIGIVGEGYISLLEWMKGEGLLEHIPIILIAGSEDLEKVRVKTTCYDVKWIITRAVRPERVAFLVNRLLFSRRRGWRSESMRVPSSIKVEVAVIERSAGDILNISATGIYLQTASPLPQGTLVRLRFALPGRDARLDLQGTVVWGKRVERGGGIFDGVGIRFEEVSPDDQRTLREYIKEESAKCTSELNFTMDEDGSPS
ncbi:MAG: hypothetical protein GY721_01995 [Deltaproteobacteria bacterium]|nr:hypothetical protein [Deltaproteobacteria bacterium]